VKSVLELLAVADLVFNIYSTVSTCDFIVNLAITCRCLHAIRESKPATLRSEVQPSNHYFLCRITGLSSKVNIYLFKAKKIEKFKNDYKT